MLKRISRVINHETCIFNGACNVVQKKNKNKNKTKPLCGMKSGGGGHSHYEGDADVRLQRHPIFRAAVTQ